MATRKTTGEEQAASHAAAPAAGGVTGLAAGAAVGAAVGGPVGRGDGRGRGRPTVRGAASARRATWTRGRARTSAATGRAAEYKSITKWEEVAPAYRYGWESRGPRVPRQVLGRGQHPPQQGLDRQGEVRRLRADGPHRLGVADRCHAPPRPWRLARRHPTGSARGRGPGRRGGAEGRQAEGREGRRAGRDDRHRDPGRGAGPPPRGARQGRAPARRPRRPPPPTSAFREGTIEMTETAEEAVVSKRARVVEEVVISKDGRDRTETVRDTVRRTDVDVQKTDGPAEVTDHEFETFDDRLPEAFQDALRQERLHLRPVHARLPLRLQPGQRRALSGRLDDRRARGPPPLGGEEQGDLGGVQGRRPPRLGEGHRPLTSRPGRVNGLSNRARSPPSNANSGPVVLDPPGDLSAEGWMGIGLHQRTCVCGPNKSRKS